MVGHAQHPEEGGRNAAAQVPPPAYQPDEKGRQIVKRQIQAHLEGVKLVKGLFQLRTSTRQ